MKNIAKAGTVESLTYDAANGIIIGTSAGGISAAVTFAVATWNGKYFVEALKQSVAAGLRGRVRNTWRNFCAEMSLRVWRLFLLCRRTTWSIFFAGEFRAGKVSQKVTDEMIEDDAKEMIRILNTEFKYVAVDFLITESESEQILKPITSSKLKNMYASNNRPKFARELLESCAESVVRRRKKISLPTTQDYVRGLRKVLEKVADNEPRVWVSLPVVKTTMCMTDLQ